ncbi:peptidylprolyl isomerase [Tropicimonas sp. TH_r6]|uniref:peptidylprolyl isomerase n=1 Tax=Tropicimonas sp. TH_r6 TaxID=3082085 RepID=UPI002954CBB2|nr:peptidylprolyl isomerase [Tropicimonas sp. TH_r6]MDV7144104.1 peptidylprolyl isomerase [Tropicimonas sp. TH_r6]
MTNKTWGAGLFALAMSASLPAQAADETANTVVATVGGAEITIGHMVAARSTLPAQYQQLEADVLWQGLLDQLVQQNAMAQSLGAEVTPATQFAIDNAISGLLAGEAIGKAVQEAVTEETLQAAYDARFADAEPSKEFHAAHILVESEEDAQAIKADLDGGADFAALAMEKSTGPSGPGGGDLGWFGEGMMVPEFENAVMALEAGSVSDPVQTQFGWHVVKLFETRLSDAPPLEEVRGDLAAEIETATVETALEMAMEKTEVVYPEAEFDPSLLDSVDLLAE